MPQREPSTRSVTLAVLSFLFAAVFYGWIVESILRGRVAFDGKYGHVEHRGIGGVLVGLFIFGIGSGITCRGLAHLKPDRSRAHLACGDLGCCWVRVSPASPFGRGDMEVSRTLAARPLRSAFSIPRSAVPPMSRIPGSDRAWRGGRSRRSGRGCSFPAGVGGAGAASTTSTRR